MKTFLLQLVLATIYVVAVASAQAQQGNWGNFAFISSTLGNNANKLCLGEGLRGSDIGCPTYAPTVLPNGNLGISNTSPIARLDVWGSISASDAIQVGQSNFTCINQISGSIRFNTTSNTLQVCTNVGWVSLASGTTGGGTLSGTGSATAVAFWNGASGLTYDTDGFYWDATNNRLGIGTNTPVMPLHIDVSLTGDAGQLRLSNAFGAAMTLGITGANANQNAFIKTNTNEDLYFQVAELAHSPTPKMVIKASGNVGVGTATPTVALSINGEVQVSNSSVACSDSTKGSIRYSTTSNTLEYCNSRAWVSAGPSDTSVVSFAVNRNNVDQTVTAGVPTTVDWTTKLYDTTSAFDLATDRYQPLVAGRYFIHGQIRCFNNPTACAAGIRKNGTVVSIGYAASGDGPQAVVSDIIQMNGSTDYVDIYGMSSAGTTIQGNLTTSFFRGALLGPQSGSGGGTANPAGISGSIQFNSAGALAGRLDIIIDPSGSVGIGTGAPKAALDVSGTIKMSGTGAEACVSGTVGTFRFNPVNGVPQICR